MNGLNLIDYPDIPDEAWTRLVQAADDRTHQMRLMVMATADHEGRPDARLLVLRGASRETRSLWFHSDCRSKKVRQLQHQADACAVAYDARDDLQLRIFGTTVLHHGNEIAEQHWLQAGMVVRSVYGSPIQPGEPLPAHDPRTHRHREIMDTEQSETGRYNFLVIELDVDRIDWVQVHGAHQRRALLRASTDWAVEPLAP